ncbi:MAG: glycoside hydrolase family 31 protein [Candidatus Hydrogenedentes bacterium]|nr:glycoside hydrolase family 31 protein [Candidatus Hydrogenedentota bacterium]
MSRKRRLLWIPTGAVALLLLIVWLYWVLPFWGMPFNAGRHTQVPITPPWALECWLWEDDANTEAAVLELLAGYEEHDIPVRTILVDSPWSTRYNDFVADETRYPKPAEFFRGLQDRGYRVVLWMTCMVDSSSKDTALTDSWDWFEQAKARGYLAGDGFETRWWKGKGGFIDYTNPNAMTWWRGLQQQVFDWGLDGWKLDGTATYFSSRLGRLPLPYQRTHAGWMTTRGYMDHYYRDEYQHGLTQHPDFITLARALDTPWPHPEGFAPLDAAPVTWVGDQDHAWKDEDEGIEEALRDILGSAKLGYCVIGSDVAGYSGGTIPPNLYIRWAQFSTFCGLFLNGGHGERRLWKRSSEELEIIRKFAWLHTELIPYMYSHVVACHRGGKPLMRPLDVDYHYLFGDDFLVAPIHEDRLTRTVKLPAGRWRYWFNDRELLEGPKEITREFPLDEYPVYVRDGAIIPLNVSRPYTGLGDRESEGFLTLCIYPYGKSEFTIHHPDGSGQTTVRVDMPLEAEVVTIDPANHIDLHTFGVLSVKPQKQKLEIELEGVHKPHILSILLPISALESVEFDGMPLTESVAWRYDTVRSRLLVKTSSYTEGRYRIVVEK